MFDSVLVVCAGNICRSPTGEYVLKQKLEGKNIKVSSAGLTALEGKPADATAKRIAPVSYTHLTLPTTPYV